MAIDEKEKDLDNEHLSLKQMYLIERYIWYIVKKWLIAVGILNITVIVGFAWYIFKELPEAARDSAIKTSEAEIKKTLNDQEDKIEKEMERLKNLIGQTLLFGNEELNKLLNKAGGATERLRFIDNQIEKISDDLKDLPANDVREVKELVIVLKNNPVIKKNILSSLKVQNEQIKSLNMSVELNKQVLSDFDSRIDKISGWQTELLNEYKTDWELIPEHQKTVTSMGAQLQGISGWQTELLNEYKTDWELIPEHQKTVTSMGAQLQGISGWQTELLNEYKTDWELIPEHQKTVTSMGAQLQGISGWQTELLNEYKTDWELIPEHQKTVTSMGAQLQGISGWQTELLNEYKTNWELIPEHQKTVTSMGAQLQGISGWQTELLNEYKTNWELIPEHQKTVTSMGAQLQGISGWQTELLNEYKTNWELIPEHQKTVTSMGAQLQGISGWQTELLNEYKTNWELIPEHQKTVTSMGAQLQGISGWQTELLNEYKTDWELIPEHQKTVTSMGAQLQGISGWQTELLNEYKTDWELIPVVNTKISNLFGNFKDYTNDDFKRILKLTKVVSIGDNVVSLRPSNSPKAGKIVLDATTVMVPFGFRLMTTAEDHSRRLIIETGSLPEKTVDDIIRRDYLRFYVPGESSAPMPPRKPVFERFNKKAESFDAP